MDIIIQDLFYINLVENWIYRVCRPVNSFSFILPHHCDLHSLELDIRKYNSLLQLTNYEFLQFSSLTKQKWKFKNLEDKTGMAN